MIGQINYAVLDLLHQLGLPPLSFILFGSGPMIALSLKDFDHDLDIYVNPDCWELAKQLGVVKEADLGGEVVEIQLSDGTDIELFCNWGPGEWDWETTYVRANIIDGIAIAGWEDVIRWKELMARSKDAQHVEMIKRFLR